MGHLRSGSVHVGGKCWGCGWWGAVAVVGLCCGGVGARLVWAAPSLRVAEDAGKISDWDAAVAARRRFEAEPKRLHTRETYEHVMNGFRAIYRGNPGDAHAAAAVAEVAELFEERGRELDDAKSVQAAVGQYEFLAKAYPGDRLAPVALEKALGLMGPEDADEAQKVRAELVQDYPREGPARTAREAALVVAGNPTSQRREVVADDGAQKIPTRDVAGQPAGLSAASANSADSGRDDRSGGVVREDVTSGRVIPEVGERESGPLAVVTGIRHWSTASYTRVAIDLNVPEGEEVKYEAARVENPDRIFFDLGHARLAPELAGKSFNVTDDGFLKRVRAAQFSDDVTRVVLDVHQVAEYSAFLLPNPYRLIIDIHGGSAEGPGPRVQGSEDAEQPVGAAPAVSERPRGAVEVSSLPPMPVTDGSASFGLPARSVDRVGDGKNVAPPRVVISSKPTAARPVPNTVMKSTADTNTEVAEVSRQPGVVEATRRPTSKPIAETSGDAGGGVDGAHYVPRSRRHGNSASPLSDDDAVPPNRAENARSGPGVAKMGHPGTAEVRGEPAEAPPPTADGETSLMRALGLKIGRIVIDAGHGGHDSGTLGVGGIEEKDVVLDVALRLGRLLHDRLGAEVVYTRDDDTFVPLETRTAIANKAQADLFISVHANSSSDPTVRGVEVYYLNFTSDPEAMMVASRENAVSTESVHELSDLVKKIALKDKIDESKDLAADVDASLYAGLRKGNPDLRNRGVKKAPFVVLIGANMPSILAEISFVTNPESAEKLETPAYRERVAESLYKGIAQYAQAINGRKPQAAAVEQAER